MKHIENLKLAKTRQDLAKLLGYKPSSLTSIVYKIPNEQKYTEFEIPKKSGDGKRVIKAPIPKLKKLQAHLSNYLHQCLIEIEHERGGKSVSFGFKRNSSILDNANKHKRQRWVLNIDLSDFFTSINFGRVRGFFLKDNRFLLEELIATTVAQIACDGEALPQGSPCSPVISELVTQILDVRLLKFAKKHRLTYTRYADDITFSTNQKDFPTDVAYKNSEEDNKCTLSNDLKRIIEKCGFKINNSKTRLQFACNRQIVTGLVVNSKVNIRSPYYRNARSMCHHLFKNGYYYKKSIFHNNENITPIITSKLHSIEGMLQFIYSIKDFEDRRSTLEKRGNINAIRSLYKKLLFYKYFLILENPIIVTEGKTDPIYLVNAIDNTKLDFIKLFDTTDSHRISNVKYFNHMGIASEILETYGGGTSNLKHIVLAYKKYLNYKKEVFNHKPMLYPVILLLDNDDGLKEIASTISTNFSVKFDLNSKDDFYYITDNLYVVKTLEKKNILTCIEDCFDINTLNTILNGKKFNSANKIDNSTDYSKEIFANRVIKPNAKNIDFSGFDPLLMRIDKALIDYQNKLNSNIQPKQ